LEHDQEEIDETEDYGSRHEELDTPDVPPFNCNAKIEVTDCKIEKSVRYNVEEFAQVSELGGFGRI
jgi:hypothetical protein